MDEVVQALEKVEGARDKLGWEFVLERESIFGVASLRVWRK